MLFLVVIASVSGGLFFRRGIALSRKPRGSMLHAAEKPPEPTQLPNERHQRRPLLVAGFDPREHGIVFAEHLVERDHERVDKTGA